MRVRETVLCVCVCVFVFQWHKIASVDSWIIVIYTTSAHLPALLHSTRLIGIKHESEGRVTLLLIELNAKLAYVHEFCR